MEDLRCQEVFKESSLSPEMSRNVGYSPAMVCRAYKDPVLLEDNRVFQNMLHIEEFYIAATNYFQNTQNEIKPHMRKIVTDWMLEVCLDQNCHADVFLLSCNIMDRFLSQLCIKKGQFQLVAAATIFIASKLVDPCPVTSTDLVKYTDNTYDLTEILEMELLILSKLKWDLSAVTPYDFLEHLLRLLIQEGAILEEESLLRRHTENFIILCATEFRFSSYPPSMLSSAAIAAAAQGLGDRPDNNYDIVDIVTRLQILTGVENDCLSDVVRQIEDTFRAASENVNSQLQPIPTTTTTKSTTTSSSGHNQSVIMNNNNKNTPALGGQDNHQDQQDLKSHTPTEVFDVAWLYVP